MCLFGQARFFGGASGSGSGDVDKTCLTRPPDYFSTRTTWSSWAAVRVGHFVFLFWFVEGGQVYVKRSNFCEGGELAAEAYYQRVCAAKLALHRVATSAWGSGTAASSPPK